jgi:hypothetical protein
MKHQWSTSGGSERPKCFSLNLPDDQLAGMAVAGMLPAIREKLFGLEFDNLGQLSHRLSLMSNQAYGFKKDSRSPNIVM